jgi:predicted anti-sigma-YlaC factor YlaD
MDCSNYVDLMTEYMEGDLSAPDQNLWEKHFDGCPNCKDFFRSFKSSVELINYVKTEGCPVPVRQRLEKVLQERLNIQTGNDS